MLIGDKIPIDDRHYYCFLLLLKICSIVLLPHVSFDTLPYLSILIEEKIALFRDLYPSSTIIPKMHYMLHYPTQILMFGPLINTWTMRQEAKLCFIKRSSQRGNFKNVPKAVSKTHQLWLAYKLEVDCKNLTSVTFELGKTTESVLSSESVDLQRMFSISCGMPPGTIVKHPKWVRVQSTTYRKGIFLIIKPDCLFPVFGEIIELSIIDTDIIFYVNMYNTMFF